MATPLEILPEVTSFKAGADLRGKVGYFVKQGTNPDEVVLCAAATDRGIGILRDEGNTGETVGVVVGGFFTAVASDAIAQNALVGTTSTGKAVALVAGTDTTKYIHAIAREASAADGDPILLQIVTPTAKAV